MLAPVAVLAGSRPVLRLSLVAGLAASLLTLNGYSLFQPDLLRGLA